MHLRDDLEEERSTRDPRRRCAVGLKVLPKHRFIMKAAKIAPHASDSPGEAQAGDGGLRARLCLPG